MTTPTTRSRRAPARTLKSPLAAPGHAAQTDVVSAASVLAASVQSPLTDRESTLAEFEGYLRTVNNRDGRPYEEKTISVYSVPAKNLDRWLSANGIEGDFTVVETPLLNRYFREYYLEHGQGGTHTLQRNLIQLFNFLERERGFASPYTDGLNRYAAVKGRPKTLSAGLSMTYSRSPGAAGPGTSRWPATTRSSASCAARASAAPNFSAW